ncbi:Calx-beta domain-containing protein [Nocardioides sp. Kera G14]|uniref:Calx-beta domain-containing protein n=1 Tax=Nocardioides sp. Kera G14 TaxID=2884264 RepID=UPI001D10213B|nr:Calx-beta domain-containing protein [Nocardioides sp. Kera G14]UDY22344.1 hypothetical protein LH076_09645 [Nocardioides sp. Kera G14]
MNALTKAAVTAASTAALALSSLALGTAAADAAKPAKPKASVTGVTVSEDAGFVTVTVTLTKKAKRKLKLNWSTQSVGKKGAATAGADYAAVKGRVVLTKGEKSADLVVPIIDDATVEGTETFYIKFNGKAAHVKKPRVAVTITDNDTTPAPAS